MKKILLCHIITFGRSLCMHKLTYRQADKVDHLIKTEKCFWFINLIFVGSSLSKSAFCGRIPIILEVKYGTKILHSNYIRGQSFSSWSNYYPEHWFLVSNLEKKPIFLTIFLSAVFFCAKLLLNFGTVAVWYSVQGICFWFQSWNSSYIFDNKPYPLLSIIRPKSLLIILKQGLLKQNY